MVLGFSSSFLKAALPGFTSCTDRLVAVLGAAADQQQQVLMHHLAILTTLEVICQVRGQGGVPPFLRSPLYSSVVPASCSNSTLSRLTFKHQQHISSKQHSFGYAGWDWSLLEQAGHTCLPWECLQTTQEDVAVMFTLKPEWYVSRSSSIICPRCDLAVQLSLDEAESP
jgi:hypothetical protein